MSWLDEAEGVLEHAEEMNEKRSDATTWKPHKNDDHPQVLKGILFSGEVASTEYGMTSVLTVEDEDGKLWTVWASGRLLKDAIDNQSPAPGKGIIIKHGGLRQPKKPGGREYRMWTVACEASDFDHWADQWRVATGKANAASGSDLDSDATRPFADDDTEIF